MTADGVSLSVCIPSYERVDRLELLLRSLIPEWERALEGVDGVVPAFETVIVLDGSTDGSEAMLRHLSADYPVPLRWQWQENAGRSAARNALIDLADGELLWFLDDDMEVMAGALERHLGWDRGKAEVMFGPSHVTGAENAGLAWFYEDRWEGLVSGEQEITPEVVLFHNATIPAGVLVEHRFDESFVGYGFEDYELALRMLNSGVTVAFDPEAKVEHHYRKSGFESLRDVREEGANRVRVAALHPETGGFAMDLRPGRLANICRPLAERGMSAPLWVAAHVVRACAAPLSGQRAFRVIRISDDLALYSGVAMGWRSGPDHVSKKPLG